MFRDLVRKHSTGKKIRSEHTWWPLRSKPAKQFKRFHSSVLLCDQLGVTETNLAEALGSSTVTEKRITQYAGGSFFVRKFHDIDFVTVLQLGSDVTTLEHDVVPSNETIAPKHCCEVDMLRESIVRCRTRSDVLSTQEKLDSANMGKKRRPQGDGRAADASKKSKVQDRKGIIRTRLEAMTVDATAIFVDQLFSTIQILCGMIDRSRAAVVRSSMEPIATAFGRDAVTIIDLSMLDEDDTPAADNLVDDTPAADNLVDRPASRFHLQDLQLPSGATVRIPNNYSNILLTASDFARYRKERKIVASLDKLLSRERSRLIHLYMIDPSTLPVSGTFFERKVAKPSWTFVGRIMSQRISIF
jgi:hypothetical protein